MTMCLMIVPKVAVDQLPNGSNLILSSVVDADSSQLHQDLSKAGPAVLSALHVEAQRLHLSIRGSSSRLRLLVPSSRQGELARLCIKRPGIL